MIDWDAILARALRPARPRLDACLRAHREYAAAAADHAHGRTRRLVAIESRLNAARAKVFAAGNGVVPAEVTAIEREWLAEFRTPGPSRDLDVLWARMAPEHWRASRVAPPTAEAMVALASDPDSVEAAERAASALRESLAPFGVVVGTRVDWIVASEIAFAVRAQELFAAAMTTLGDVGHRAVQDAHRLRRNVRERLGDRDVVTRNSSLGRELGWLAFASSSWSAQRTDAPPFAPVLEIYRLGYVPSAVDASGVTLGALPA
jgi:hypothetical protein